jgi:plasmid stabilization system protein ParE
VYKLVISALAHGDLDSIVFYIAERLAAPKAAADFLDSVDLCYSHLRDNPLMYEKCRNERLRQEDYRKAVVKNYVLVYKVDEEAQAVNIYRFFHGSQDYVNLI